MPPTPRKLTSEEVKARLAPAHLIPDVEDLMAEAVQATSPETDNAPEDDPRGQREYTFSFNWRDGRGKVWEGKFTNKILSIKERQQVGIVRARLQAGVPATAIDNYTEELNLIVAHTMFSFTKTPKWAEDLTALDNYELIQALYGEVASHEAYFFGYGTYAEEGPSEPEGRPSEDP